MSSELPINRRTDGKSPSEHPRPTATWAAATPSEDTAQYRIYGDNILECERVLHFMAEAVANDETAVVWSKSALYAPRYEVRTSAGRLFSAQLFPGYGRWGYDVQAHLRQLGAPLRERTDAVVLRLDREATGILAVPVLAVEFCNALAAGNNVWQRCGRALACAYAGVPYLYFAELGGIELDAKRNELAARFPNPLVPFAYVCLGQTTNSLTIPVFTPSPSITEDIARRYEGCLGEAEAKAVVGDLLIRRRSASSTSDLLLAEKTHCERENCGGCPAMRVLQEKAIRAIQAAASSRKRIDTLRDEEWSELARQSSGADRARWLLNRRMPWRKKVKAEGLTATFPRLLEAAYRAGAVAAGAKEIPICLLSPAGRAIFATEVVRLYAGRVDPAFAGWLRSQEVPLVVLWVRGFKPGGDDSRPDRGLAPLARMLFGSSGVEYLTVAYGPAPEAAWRLLATDMQRLARSNGLWEAIIGLSNAVLVDSATATNLTSIGLTTTSGDGEPTVTPPALPDASDTPRFGEQDVDTVLHSLFSNASHLGLFEGMCNPPGGDWSGMSFQSSAEGEVLRWTSLPRVSGQNAKRPDHIVLFYGPPIRLIAVESKDTAKSVEPGIGPRLTRFVSELASTAPNIVKAAADRLWRPFSGSQLSEFPTPLSAAAFRFRSTSEMEVVLTRGNVDIVLAVEFTPGEESVLLHVLARPAASWLGTKLIELCERFRGRIEVQIH